MSSEQCSISTVNRAEGWQLSGGAGRVQRLMNGAHSPLRGLQTGPHQSAKWSTGGWAMPAGRQPRGFRCTEHALSHDRLTDTLTRSGHKCRGRANTHTQLCPHRALGSAQKCLGCSLRYILCGGYFSFANLQSNDNARIRQLCKNPKWKCILFRPVRGHILLVSACKSNILGVCALILNLPWLNLSML